MSADVTLKFDDQKIIEAIAAARVKAINVAADHLEAKMKANFGSEGGGVARRQKFAFKRQVGSKDFVFVGGKRVKQRANRNVYEASPPGTFPGVRKGHLRGSIQVDPATRARPYALVGTGRIYGRWLEFGTIGVARDKTRYAVPARPWCLRTLNQERSAIQNIISTEFTAELARRLSR